MTLYIIFSFLFFTLGCIVLESIFSDITYKDYELEEEDKDAKSNN